MKKTKLITVTIFVFIALSFILGFIYNSTNYWNNFWNFWPSFLGAIIAIVIFISQIEIENSKNRKLKINDNNEKIKNDYFKFQDDMMKNILKLLLDFSPELREDTSKNKTKTKQLAVSLVTLLYSASEAETQRNRIDKVIDDNNEDEQNRLVDFSEVDSQITQILNDNKNKDIIDLVEKTYPDLKAVIKSRTKFNKDTRADQKKDNDIILGHWILKLKNAQNAKYLIGVSTIDKRILGTFKIDNGKKISRDEDTNRIYFGDGASPITNVDPDNNKNNPIMPHLQNWISQNPILYYKQYLSSKNIVLSQNDKKIICNTLNIAINEYDKLNGRDIIVVRTSLLD